MMPSKPVLVTPEPQIIGAGFVPCEFCGDELPIPTYMWVEVDEDGDECVVTAPSTVDLEAHQLTHAEAR